MTDRNQLINYQKLSFARIQLHYAIQPLAAVSALSKAQSDSSHLALKWHKRLGFSTQEIKALQAYQFTLDPLTLVLAIVSDRQHIVATFNLVGQTLTAAFDWIKSVVQALGGSSELVVPLSYPPDDFPDSDIARNHPFQILEQTPHLINHFDTANHILQELIRQEPVTSPVRIWSHHFDIATTISIPFQINGQPVTLGVGLSPGDRYYEEPYWYVTPYPYPQNLNYFPALDGHGSWHTSHWVGAVLKASQFGEPATSIAQVRTFLDSAIAICKQFPERG